MKYDPAVQCLILEQHVNAVLAARNSGPEDLLRAAGMVRALWTELSPSRWALLLRSIETHSYPRFLFNMARSIPTAPVADLSEARVAAELREAIAGARHARLPTRGAALLLVAHRVGAVPHMDPLDLRWAIPREPESARCLSAWVVAHGDDLSFAAFADLHARSLKLRSSLGRSLTWSALWLEPTAARWRRYARHWTESVHSSESRAEPAYVEQRLQLWIAFLEETMLDGSARLVLSHRDGARSALAASRTHESDPFVSAVLSFWSERDRAGTWQEEAYADDGW